LAEAILSLIAMVAMTIKTDIDTANKIIGVIVPAPKTKRKMFTSHLSKLFWNAPCAQVSQSLSSQSLIAILYLVAN
jgi:hypothetical protein